MKGDLPCDVKRTVRDSVFRDLFEDRRYALQLYRAINPEDQDVTEADIGDVTISNVFTDQEYNDLGMTVRGKLLLLLECQSTWSVNIIVRILLYLTHTWNEQMEATGQNRYGSRKLELLKPEFYVIYTGERKGYPEWISLSQEFLEGNTDYLEVKARVLYGEGKKDIISQYVDFTRVYREQRKRYGKSRETIRETIRICKDRDVLRDYLADREKEIMDIMTALFDQEKVMEQYLRDVVRDITEEVTAQVTQEVTAEVTREVTREVTERVTKEVMRESKKETALALFEMGMPMESIAKAVKMGVEVVREWILKAGVVGYS